MDPPEPRPDAHEFVLVLGGWDVDGDGRDEGYASNGIAGFFHRFPIKVPVGEPVRCYVLNMTEYMFHRDQHHMADRGAMGWFAAI